MAVAALVGAERFFGEQVVLAGVHLVLQPGDRVALIGRNGAGKSTLLRALAMRETLDAGECQLAVNAVVGYLAQDDENIDLNATVEAIADTAFTDLDALEAELDAHAAAGLDDPERFEKWTQAYARFERRGGPSRRSRRDSLLHAFALTDKRQQRFGALSGGERTRFRLARLLMQQPDLLLLDEPTNHLDLAMRGYLASLIARYPGAVVVVSHDRALLDEACSRTVEVSMGQLHQTNTNPSGHHALRQEQRRIQARTHAREQRERDRLEASATRMKGWAGQNEKLHRRARAMERRLERFEADMVDAPEKEAGTLRFSFPCETSAEMVLYAEHLSAAYERTLFQDVNLFIRQGERVALIGRNGAGKTTLLRMLLGDRASENPKAIVRWGARVRVGVLDQHLHTFDPNDTLIEVLIRRMGEVDAHNALGRFMFPYEAQFKTIAQLSGGERMRLGLLNLSLENANVLVLDEPTNHLDAEMIEALEEALLAYQGTVLLVSHDRRLLERLATRVWEVAEGHFINHERDFHGYTRQQSVTKRVEEPPTDKRDPADNANRHASRAKEGRSPWQLRRDIQTLEDHIAELEGEVVRVVQALSEAASETDVVLVRALGEEHERLNEALLETMAQWETASEELARALSG